MPVPSTLPHLRNNNFRLVVQAKNICITLDPFLSLMIYISLVSKIVLAPFHIFRVHLVLTTSTTTPLIQATCISTASYPLSLLMFLPSYINTQPQWLSYGISQIMSPPVQNPPRSCISLRAEIIVHNGLWGPILSMSTPTAGKDSVHST